MYLLLSLHDNYRVKTLCFFHFYHENVSSMYEFAKRLFNIQVATVFSFEDCSSVDEVGEAETQMSSTIDTDELDLLRARYLTINIESIDTNKDPNLMEENDQVLSGKSTENETKGKCGNQIKGLFLWDMKRKETALSNEVGLANLNELPSSEGHELYLN